MSARRPSPLAWLVVVLGLGFLSACAMLAPETSFAATHPEKLGPGRPMCSTCHTTDLLNGARKPFGAFDHTPAFVKDHGLLAGRDPGTCATCHGQSFCSDCHGGKTMIPPAVFLGNRPDRATPHPAAYLSIHQIDGKLDPARCYTCHGRANQERCAGCHR